MKKIWVLVSENSLKDKIDRWQATEHHEWEIEFVSLDELLLVISHNNKFVLSRNGSEVDLPAACISLIPQVTEPVVTSLLYFLQSGGCKVINPPSASRIAHDKWMTHCVLAANNLPSLETIYISENKDLLDQAADQLEYPLVLKKAVGSRGLAVWLVRDQEELQSTVSEHFLNKVGELSVGIVLQKYLESSHGRDRRVIVLGNTILGAMERRGSGFHANISAGGSAKKVELSEESAHLALKATRLTGLDFAGIDLLYDGTKSTWVVGEVNSNPGLQFEDITGVSVTTAILDWLSDELR